MSALSGGIPAPLQGASRLALAGCSVVLGVPSNAWFCADAGFTRCLVLFVAPPVPPSNGVLDMLDRAVSAPALKWARQLRDQTAWARSHSACLPGRATHLRVTPRWTRAQISLGPKRLPLNTRTGGMRTPVMLRFRRCGLLPREEPLAHSVPPLPTPGPGPPADGGVCPAPGPPALR